MRTSCFRAVRNRGPERPEGEAEDEDDAVEIPDMYDAEGELDPGAVRAEIDRLLRHLNVAPERVDSVILPPDDVPDVPDAEPADPGPEDGSPE